MELECSVEEEELMLNILLNDESFGEGQSSLKRKATDDLIDDGVKQKGGKWIQHKRKSRRNTKHKKHTKPEGEMIVRPNYFVGIQVSNPEIHKMVKMVQDNILRMEPALKSVAIEIPTLHITLAVIHLPDVHVKRAAELVEKCTSNHKEFFNKSASLHFTGLNTFQNKVLFAGVQRNEVLDRVYQLATDIETAFEELRVRPLNKKDLFKPHLTIFKVSKDPSLRRKGISKISSDLYSNMINTEFGTQVIRGVQFLAMHTKKDLKGYYSCIHQVPFDVSTSESEDHSECCLKPLSVKSNLKNVSQLQKKLSSEKAMVKRRIHSQSLPYLTPRPYNTMPSNTVPSNHEGGSILKKLLILSAAAVATIAIVRAVTSRN